MRNLLGAITFLTIIPLPFGKNRIGIQTLAWFPLVGILIGSIVYLFFLSFFNVFPKEIVSLLCVFLLALITGAIHLDGLADSADGLFSHRNREEALRIMKASNIGVMGTLALFFVLALKWSAIFRLSGYGPHYWLDFALPPAYGRAAILLGAYFLPYARPEGGTAKDFIMYRKGLGQLLPVILLMACPLLAGAKRFMTVNLVFIFLSVILLTFYRKKIGGITGDMLGALSELTETAVFLTGITLE